MTKEFTVKLKSPTAVVIGFKSTKAAEQFAAATAAVAVMKDLDQKTMDILGPLYSYAEEFALLGEVSKKRGKRREPK